MLFPKPARGSHVLDREKKRAEIEKDEEAAKKSAKLRDGLRCRWPEAHKCRGLLEGAHIFRDKGMGGDHGTVSDTGNLMALCSWIHRRGPQSIHGKQLRVEPETSRGADGPCSFYRLDANDEWTCVGVEITIGVLRKS
jgi:hypothetical protein